MSSKIEASTLHFLKNLSKNNNREWFTENKDQYIAAHQNVLNMVENLIEKIDVNESEIYFSTFYILKNAKLLGKDFVNDNLKNILTSTNYK